MMGVGEQLGERGASLEQERRAQYGGDASIQSGLHVVAGARASAGYFKLPNTVVTIIKVRA